MCLGIPGKITEIYESNSLLMAKIDFGGVTREACVQTIPDAKVGDYTIIHAGFALNTLSEEEAKASLDALAELSMIEDEFYPEDPQ